MTSWTLGTTCHIILQHDSVNSGLNYGFILNTDGSIKSEGIQVKRQMITEDISDTQSALVNYQWIYFDVLLGDHLIAPNGSVHTEDRDDDYAKLCEYLAQTSGLNVTTPMGSFLNYSAVGYTADERHKPEISIVKVALCNVGSYFPPSDPYLLTLSTWIGDLPWGTCIWR